MEINNKQIIIINNDSNNITYFKKDIHINNDNINTQNQFPQRIKEINEDKNDKYNEINTNKKNNTVKSPKKSKKKFLFCCFINLLQLLLYKYIYRDFN